MANLKILGENIKKRRIELGITLEELAKLTGYASKSGVAKVESGNSNINQNRIFDFAKALQTTPATLLGVPENPISINRLLSLGFDREKLERLTLSDIETIRNVIINILDNKK